MVTKRKKTENPTATTTAAEKTDAEHEGPGSGEQRGYANSRTGDRGNFNTDPDQQPPTALRSRSARGV